MEIFLPIGSGSLLFEKNPPKYCAIAVLPTHTVFFRIFLGPYRFVRKEDGLRTYKPSSKEEGVK
jgi:hypothetical protein